MKKYNIIIKVNEKSFLKYRNISNMRSFLNFISRRYPKFRWANIYDGHTRKQIDSFTQKSMPLYGGFNTPPSIKKNNYGNRHLNSKRSSY